MSIRKKMSMGILAGALGVSLIGGGTWAAFNDVETTSNTFAAGTLDLVVGEATTLDFKISNMKPGDYFTKQLVLKNNGSLDIDQIFMHATKESGWKDKDELGLGIPNTEDDFLSQFSIEVTENGTEVYNGTLAALVAGDRITELTGSVDTDDVAGLPAGGSDKVYDVKVTFVEDSTLIAGTRLHEQNKYQGEQSNLKFVFEGTQMPGEDRSNNTPDVE